MGKERSRSRISSKIDQLPDEVRNQVDVMIIDTSITYTEISEWIKSRGYEISKSAVGRYAMRTNTAVQRLLEAQKQTEALISVVQKNPDVDYTEASMMLLMDGLVNKMATAQEEFDEMPLDKAGRLVIAGSRSKAYKDKVKMELSQKVEVALDLFKKEIKRELQNHPETLERLLEIADNLAKDTSNS